jgi:hypothetical protein
LVIGNYPDTPPTLRFPIRLRPWEAVVMLRGNGRG